MAHFSLHNRVWLVLLLLSGQAALGQNFIETGNFNNNCGWDFYGRGGCTSAYFLPGAGSSFTWISTANGTGDRYFRLFTDWGGNFRRHEPAPTTQLMLSTEYTLQNNGGLANAYYINAPNTTDNYVFKTRFGDGFNNAPQLIIFRVQGAIQNILSTSEAPVVAIGANQAINITLSGPLPAGQGAYLRYSTDNFATSVILPMTCTGNACSANIPPAVNTNNTLVRYYAFTSGSGLSIAHDKADWYTINFDNNPARGGNNYRYRVAEPVICGLTASPPLNAVVEPGYTHLTEFPFARPLYAQPDDASALNNSDFVGEGSNGNTYNTAAMPPNAVIPGSTDIQQFYASWTPTHLHLAVSGPTAHIDQGSDNMDLFIAIDTDNNTGAAVTRTAANCPGNKRVDFAGWSPEYFVWVDRIRSGGSLAAFYQGTTSVATDSNPNADGNTGFELAASAANGVTEIRIAWALLGGKPNDVSGAPWNFAVYTAYQGAGYDAFDSGPGTGNGVEFESVADCPFDSDHCGPGNFDPVTGLNDPCSGANNDSNNGAGTCATSGSDNSTGDIDTIEEYYHVENTGQTRANLSILCTGSFGPQVLGCSLPPAPVSGSITTPAGIAGSAFVQAGGSIGFNGNEKCYMPLSLSSNDVASGGDPCGLGIGQTVTRTYILSDPAGNTASCTQTFSIVILDASQPLLEGRWLEGESAARLVWTMQGAQPAARFELQRALPGALNFMRIAALPADAFRYVDEALPPGARRVLYRITAIGADGAAAYSNVVELQRERNWRIELSPNPARGFVRLSLSGAAGRMAAVSLYTAEGRRVWAATPVAAAEQQSWTLDLNGLAAGLYTLGIMVDGTVLYRKLALY